MANVEKIDMGLFMALRTYEESPDKHPEDGIGIGLRFEGDLQSIEALGFVTQTVMGDTAYGEVKFKDVEAISAHPGVIWMSAGENPRPYLDTAVPDIKARAAAKITGPPPADGVWHVEKSTGDLSSIPDATGKDVIVAIIDSGIDYTHPMFIKDFGPPITTRILSIWDMGLRPTASHLQCPDKALLASTETYGIEYDTKEIEDALNRITSIKHRDCMGHGTHVAGIAAGGTKFFAGGADASFVGVAPEATIIAVKLLDNANPIQYRLPGGFGGFVPREMLFKDAVMYCLRMARKEKKPVVINMSFGSNAEPGDGLDEDAVFMDQVLDPSKGETPSNFPTGAIIVKAAGNDGDEDENQTARIVFAGVTEVIVPFELKDSRAALKTRWLDRGDKCHDVDFTPPVGVDFWYRRATPFDSVKFALRLPHQAGFSGDMPIGGNLSQAFILRSGPPPSMALVPFASNVYSVFVNHMTNGPVADPRPGPPVPPPIRRHQVSFRVVPKQSGGTVDYPVGVYEMRIKAPVDTEIYVMCDRWYWARGKAVTFEVREKLANDTPIDTALIKISDESSAVDTGGKHVITVAAYDDKNGAGPDKGEIAKFSSRGPLRDFSIGKLGPIAPKPDIAAPGVKIMSAQGVNTSPLLPRGPHFASGARYIEFQGTSMAAPVVAGVIALMLDKKKDLNTDDVRKHLTAITGPPVKPTGADGDRAYGKGMVNALESHKRSI